MLLGDIMKVEVHNVGLHASIVSAADKMRDADLDCLFVTRGGEVVGSITGKQLASCLGEGHRPERCQVFRHMTIGVNTAPPTMAVADAAEMMLKERLSCLPVTGVVGLVGQVSLADIVRGLIDEVNDTRRASGESVVAQGTGEGMSAG